MARRMIAAGLVVVAGLTGTARAAEVEVVKAFEGNKGPSWKETADISGAVGPKHVVAWDGGGFLVQDKADGKVVRKMTPREFWNSVEAAPKIDPQKDPNDPKIIYDPLSGRWFASSAGTKGSNGDSWLAVSASSDPTGPWKGALLPVPKIDPGVHLAADKNGLYVCSCCGFKSGEVTQNCFAMPMADALAPGGPVFTNGRNFPDLTYAVYPAMDSNPNKAADAPEIVMNNEFKKDPGSGKLYMYKITWDMKGNTGGTPVPRATMSPAQEIPLSRVYYTARQMDCAQPGTTVKLRSDSGRRADSFFVKGESVFGCFSAKDKAASHVGIVWFEVRIADGKVVQEGFVDDPKADYLYPSLAVDAKGNIGIGCTKTSETEFPSVCVMMKPAGNLFLKAVVALKGTTAYKYDEVPAVNWSHYSSTCIDPSDANLFWTYQGYGNSEVNRQWCGGWAAFKLAGKAAEGGK